jgi:hypothetical protein
VGATAGDTVTITQAAWRSAQGRLLVRATSSNASAVLSVYDASDSTFLGTLTGDGSGNYSGQIPWPVNPGLIEVRSSLGGYALRNARTS